MMANIPSLRDSMRAFEKSSMAPPAYLFPVNEPALEAVHCPVICRHEIQTFPILNTCLRNLALIALLIVRIVITKVKYSLTTEITLKKDIDFK